MVVNVFGNSSELIRRVLGLFMKMLKREHKKRKKSKIYCTFLDSSHNEPILKMTIAI